MEFPSCPTEEAQTIAAHACKIGSGRVGRSNVADAPIRAAVIAHIRHEHTNYDSLLDHMAREEARDMVREQIYAIADSWAESTTQGAR